MALTSPKPTRHSFLVFGRPDIREAEIDEVVATLRSGWIGTGPRAKQFEEEFAAYVGARHAIAVNSCTAALHLSLLALGIGPGDEVITSTMTFAATVNVILHVGARPVLVDVDEESQNMQADAVEAAISPKTKAIIPVHMAGRPCDMTALTALARGRGLAVIEDAAHATEAFWRDQKIGSISTLTAFSFYATKNLVTGEGGMVTTNDDDLAADIRIRSLHGMSRDAWKRYSSTGYAHYDVVLPGWKYNMTDIQAALGLHQLRRLDENLERRKAIWARYDAALREVPGIQIPSPFTDGVHARHLYTIRVLPEAGLPRDKLIDELKLRNIGTGVHFRPIHSHSYFRRVLDAQPATFPIASRIGETTLSLPLSTALTDSDVDDVLAAVVDSLEHPSS